MYSSKRSVILEQYDSSKSNPPNDDFTEIIRHIENLRNHVIDYLALQVDYGYAGSMT